MLTRISVVAACSAMMFVAVGARADEWDKKTTVTFNQAVELPGVTLPAGTYVFKLVDLPGTRNVVQVFNAEENKVFASILAIPHLHPAPHEKPYLGFEERRAGTPMAIHEWFYPGHVSGLEFVYPKLRAQELARASGQPVLAGEVKPAETPVELQQAPVLEVTPDDMEIQVAETFDPAPPPIQAALEPPAHERTPVLPETGSPVPLIALAGVLSLGIAAALKALIRSN